MVAEEKKRIPEELYRQIIEVMPRLCVDIVLKCGDEVLVLKRRIDPLKGFWALPGGMVYKGETLKGAAIRIADAELGVKVLADNLRMVGVANFEDILGMRHDVCLTYVAVLENQPEIVMDYQHREYKWATFNELQSLGEEINVKVAMQIEWAFGFRSSTIEV